MLSGGRGSGTVVASQRSGGGTRGWLQGGRAERSGGWRGGGRVGRAAEGGRGCAAAGGSLCEGTLGRWGGSPGGAWRRSAGTPPVSGRWGGRGSQGADGGCWAGGWGVPEWGWHGDPGRARSRSETPAALLGEKSSARAWATAREALSGQAAEGR